MNSSKSWPADAGFVCSECENLRNPTHRIYVWYIYLHLAKIYGFHVGNIPYMFFLGAISLIPRINEILKLMVWRSKFRTLRNTESTSQPLLVWRVQSLSLIVKGANGTKPQKWFKISLYLDVHVSSYSENMFRICFEPNVCKCWMAWICVIQAMFLTYLSYQ